MDTENVNDEHNPALLKDSLPAKSVVKERSHSQTTPTDTDINDPENLDYEDVDDNHQAKQVNHAAKKNADDGKPTSHMQDEEDNDGSMPARGNAIDRAPSDAQHSAPASDEGELDDADLEDGEIHDPSTSKAKSDCAADQLDEQNRNPTSPGVPSSPQTKVHCRFFLQGRCHWGPNCKYIHPSNDSIKNHSGTPIDSSLPAGNHEVPSPTPAATRIPQTALNSWISPQPNVMAPTFFPNPLLRGQAPPMGIPLIPPSGAESAWERGLRSAKTLREQSIRRKQQDKDFNDKKFNLTIRDATDDRETDDHLRSHDRMSPINYDLPGSHYPDRYPPYMYSDPSGAGSYNNHPHRPNNNSRHNSTASNSDRRTRHSEDYGESRNDNRHRSDRSSAKDSRSGSKRDDSASYRRNSSQSQYASGSHHYHDDQSRPVPHGGRRGDDWHDPWDRSKNHSSNHRRSSGGGRDRSFSASSSSSSSSRSSRSRSKSSSSSSRSRSRSRPRRRSPSVTRATRPAPATKSTETVKNGNEKKSNGSKRATSPSTTTDKFLPGRQISSHTLKKAEKSSTSSHASTNNHSKESRGKDAVGSSKRGTKKENTRSDSTSSSSSSDSDTNRVTRRSSSSSSDSSSSDNDTPRTTKAKAGKTSAAGASQSKKSSSRPASSLTTATSAANSKSTTSKGKSDSTSNRETSSTSTKKRRDTSSSTGSTGTSKKTKLNDSHKSSTDASNAENSDSSKKKEKQKILKKLQEVEKLISQRSTKTSS